MTISGPNRPITDYTLLSAFHRHAREEGYRIAVIDGDTGLDYASLNRRTNQLGRTLQKLGVGPGVSVGIAIDRSADLIVAILAVVKAGGAYVPLDPNYPKARLSLMLERTQPRVIITLDRHISQLAVSSVTILISMDGTNSISSESEEDIAQTASPEDSLYVIFTSGSTGEPKGAVVQRRGFANLIQWYQEEFSINAEDRLLLLSSPSFDLTQKNFFTPLSTGGTLICYPPGPFDLTRLAGMIERHKITIMNCTPSAFYPLIDPPGEDAFKRVASLRLVVLGGETISIPRLQPWLEHSSCHAEIANTY
ncbi:MAG: AMP-binding protein, partial [Chthoniobacterales bacterium]